MILKTGGRWGTLCLYLGANMAVTVSERYMVANGFCSDSHLVRQGSMPILQKGEWGGLTSPSESGFEPKPLNS